jgi:hypothetical protein
VAEKEPGHEVRKGQAVQPRLKKQLVAEKANTIS